MSETSPVHSQSAVGSRIKAVLADHLDPRWGSAFWLDRAAIAGVRSPEDVAGYDDLIRLLSIEASDLRQRPLMHYVPRRYHEQRHRFVIGQTGGTTGPGAWTVYLDHEFHEAFVEPFTVAARCVGFPEGLGWLFVGPTGPHIIGKAAAAIARSVASCEPFAVDFDPRWSRKMPAGSAGAKRYLDHVLNQALDVIEQQRIGVLFATPPVLTALAQGMTAAQRAQVKGVHYGGMAVDDATLRRLREEAFPDAVHLSGYGNTLFGCCLQLHAGVTKHLDYFPLGVRLILDVVDDKGRPAVQGRVRATRLDSGSMIVGLLERDVAERVDPSPDAPAGFILPGVRDPHSPVAPDRPAVATLY